MKKTLETKEKISPVKKIGKAENRFAIECFGVKIAVSSNRAEVLRRIKAQIQIILPVEYREISFDEAAHFFRFDKKPMTGKIVIERDGEVLGRDIEMVAGLDVLTSQIRLTVAEFASGLIFLHAGVVGWKGRAIIIPGKSFAGKTTLVAEFARNGCRYFSDEYALLDEHGRVHPFPKKLSVRGIADDYTQVDFEVEELGGRRAREPLPVGFILVTKYKKKARPKLLEISPGEGILAGLANSISVRHNPPLVLQVLHKAAQQSLILKTERGEAADFVKEFFEYLDKKTETD